MLIAEYDYDTDVAVQREESYEEGYAKGYAKGHAEGYAEVLDTIVNAAKALKSGIPRDEVSEQYGADITDKILQLL